MASPLGWFVYVDAPPGKGGREKEEGGRMLRMNELLFFYAYGGRLIFGWIQEGGCEKRKNIGL